MSQHYLMSPLCASPAHTSAVLGIRECADSSADYPIPPAPPPPPDDLVDTLHEPPNYDHLIGNKHMGESSASASDLEVGDTYDDLDDEDYEFPFNSSFNSDFISQSHITTPTDATTESPTTLEEPNQPSVPPQGRAIIPCLESGEAPCLPADYGRGRYCFTKLDCSLMRLYHICDQAGSPHYLMDQIIGQLKIEMSRNRFNPSLPSSNTRRDPFMARMHRKFPSPPP
jgi:hypothetical protein